MNQTAQQALPGQENYPMFKVENDTFKKDLNFIILLEEELRAITDSDIEPGDQIEFGIQREAGEQATWVGAGVVSHVIRCYLLDIPTMAMSGHQDPRFKNALALYNHLQTRTGRKISPVDLVYCIGFRPFNKA